MSDYLDLFIEESSENLDELEKGLMELETLHGPESLDKIRDLFRFAHNLKGMAATVGQDGITTLAHRMEDLLDLFRNGVAEPDSDAIDELLEGTDHLASMLGEVPGGTVPTAPEDLLAQLETRIEGIHAVGGDTDLPPPPSTSAAEELGPLPTIPGGCVRVLVTLEDGVALPGARSAVILNLASTMGSIEEIHPDRDSVLAGTAPVFAIDLATSDGTEVVAAIGRMRDVASATPIVDTPPGGGGAGVTVPDGAVGFTIRLRDGAALPGARAAIAFNAIGNPIGSSPDRETILAGKAPEFTIFADTGDPEAIRAKLAALTDVDSVSVVVPAPDDPAAPGGRKAQTGGAPSRATVRVEVERLDDLMNLVGELVIGRGQLEQRARAAGDRSLADVVGGLSRTISDLQSAVARARMLTLDGTFSRLKRLVRDTSKDLGKDIEFTVDGGETELDRSMIDKVADPLVHLLRNALDHGIEDPDTRVAAGKAPVGSISLRAETEGNQVVITIADDGGGIDAERVSAKALEKGIVSEEQLGSMSVEDKQALIFLPGFSTKDRASSVSGRGVGMDVVRTSVNELGGAVEIVSVQGEGSTFQIHLPLSLAVLDVLLVTICDQTWAIPLQHVEETINVGDGDLGGVLGSPVVALRGETIGVIHGSRVIGHAEPPSTPFQAVVFRHRNDRWALSVDNLLEQAEVVVKPSPDELADVGHVAGATILGDGRVSMILDLAAVVSNLTRESLRHVS